MDTPRPALDIWFVWMKEISAHWKMNAKEQQSKLTNWHVKNRTEWCMKISERSAKVMTQKMKDSILWFHPVEMESMIVQKWLIDKMDEVLVPVVDEEKERLSKETETEPEKEMTLENMDEYYANQPEGMYD